MRDAQAELRTSTRPRRRPGRRDSLRITAVCGHCQEPIGSDLWPPTTFDRDRPHGWAEAARAMYGALHEADHPGHEVRVSWEVVPPAMAPRVVVPSRSHRLGMIE